MRLSYFHSFLCLLILATALQEQHAQAQQLKESETSVDIQQVASLPEEISSKTKCLNPDFLVYLPEEYAATSKMPLMIFLHGRGERGRELEQVKKHGPPKLIKNGKEFPFIVVSPQCLKLDTDKGWWNTSDLQMLLEHVVETYKVDSDRIYLTGLSMGGFTTWWWATERPDNFAAIAPICGPGNEKQADKIAHLPIWAFHGAKDTVVPIEGTQKMVDALKDLGSDVKFTIYPNAGHDSFTETYNNPELYEWFLAQTKSARKKNPEAETDQSGNSRESLDQGKSE